MKVLVTGATGFVGVSLVKELVKRKYKVTCFVRNESYLGDLERLGVKFVFGDISDKKSIERAIWENEIIFHLVGLQSFSDDFKIYDRMYKVNVNGCKNLLSAIISKKTNKIKKIVYLSTTACVGLTNGVIDEKVKCNPVSPYQKTKYVSENIFLDYFRKYNLPVVIIRSSMIYGPGGDHSQILRMAKTINKGFFPLVGKGNNNVPLIFISDLVDSLILASSKGRDGEIYFITNEEKSTLNDLIRNISESLAKKVIVIHVPIFLAKVISIIIAPFFYLISVTPPISFRRIESMTANRVFSVGKAKKELGFRQSISLKEGIKIAVDWYKEHNFKSPTRMV